MVTGLIAAGVALLALGLWGLFESQWVRCRRRELELPGLPETLDGFRILHVSDLHLGAISLAWLSARKAASWAEKRDSDLVVVTGDLLSARRGREELHAFVGRMRSRHGVLGVLGNHDVSVTRDPFSSSAGLESDTLPGLVLLRDESVRIEASGASVLVAGIDASSYLTRSVDADGLSGEADLRVLLSHYPTVVDRISPAVFDLVLAGHMHGGQICVPWPGGKLRLAHPGAPYPEGVRRLHGGESTLVVSRGLGTTFVPFRFLARPELTELVLRAPTLAT